MELKQAIEIVSYKLALKQGKGALENSLLSKEIVQQALQDLENDSVKKVDAKSYLLATKTLKAEKERLFKEQNEQFLTDNLNNAELKTTSSGLQYLILKEGSGHAPNLESEVEVHYKGALIDGTTFDSSYERGEASSFPLKKVIAGWREGLQLMKTGAHYRFFISQELGYGDRGTSSGIPAYATLIFEVELLAVF